MNIKLLFGGIATTVVTVGGTLGYLLTKENKSIKKIPSGKTLKARYPELVVPEQKQSLDFDNSFWRQKTIRLREKYLNREDWSKILKSIKDTGNQGEKTYFVGDNYFNLNERKSFLVGDPEISTILSKYCHKNWNVVNETIKDYPEFMRDICTSEIDK